MESTIMSTEEMKIRNELEMDVERDLEEEIKDGIYHLALRLHRLYQHQKDKNGRESSHTNDKVQLGSRKKKTTVSEVNLNIRMEGGTKIEIKETKKEAHEDGHPRSTSRSEDRSQEIIVASNRKKFDWTKTLRAAAGPNPMIIKKVIDSTDKAKMVKKELYHHVNENVKVEGLGKRNVSIKREQRELGWKD